MAICYSMEESGTSGVGNNNRNRAPITSIAQDHLVTILLLLPSDSILSFAMTCKRFRALIFSDTLWESICRRDWGLKSVDALKSSDLHFQQQQQLPWMRLYKQVFRLGSVSCHNLTYPDSELLVPRPRASHSLNFVSDCLVLFGGGCEGGRHLDDTWVSFIGKGFQKMPKWQKVNSGIPSGRFGHTCVVMVVQNDTWVGQVACHETSVITLSWKLLDLQSVAPPSRGAHAACSVDDSLCYGAWREILTYPSPPARSGHSLTCIGGRSIVLFGGRGLGYEVLNDVWVLDRLEGYDKWAQIPYELPKIPEGVSLPRVGHSATPIVGKDDFWVLDVSAIPSISVQPSTLNSSGLLAKMWKKFEAKGHKPNCRSFHQACADPSGRYLYVFGGMIDRLVQAAESPDLSFDRNFSCGAFA
ncbi:hypothetical protein I3842_Q123900 [Carya illinoinensis]|uniref:F-box domain-containing protein n=1 Tax=Carya illinoinensis TaxID=32201 RepID=A0A922D027_CARIL|nr:hypothetical protein I3842_Q123900 [Carya illinoinensis]